MDYVIMRKDDLQPLANAIKETKGIPASTKLILEEMEEHVLEKNTSIETQNITLNFKSGNPGGIVWTSLEDNELKQNVVTSNFPSSVEAVIGTSFIIVKPSGNTWINNEGGSNSGYNCNTIGSFAASATKVEATINKIILSNQGGSN